MPVCARARAHVHVGMHRRMGRALLRWLSPFEKIDDEEIDDDWHQRTRARTHAHARTRARTHAHQARRQRDCNGATSIDAARFVDVVFELADTWCVGICAAEYSEFLDTLRLNADLQACNAAASQATADETMDNDLASAEWAAMLEKARRDEGIPAHKFVLSKFLRAAGLGALEADTIGKKMLAKALDSRDSVRGLTDRQLLVAGNPEPSRYTILGL